MPAPMTEKQQAFALEYASNGGNATAAAKTAGYSEVSAHELGRQLLEKPHVREAIHGELMKLKYRSGVVGLSALVNIAQDEKSPPAARVSAARALVEHAGLLESAKGRKDDTPDSEEKSGKIIDYQSVLRGIADSQKHHSEVG